MNHSHETILFPIDSFQMNTLQETVHRECTEREQLKDALIDARQQLLAIKKNGL